MHNLDAIKVVYVVIDDDTRQAYVLYVDGELEATGFNSIQKAMSASLESGWSGRYERINMNGLSAYLTYTEYAHMPDSLENLLEHRRVEHVACVFSGELD